MNELVALVLFLAHQRWTRSCDLQQNETVGFLFHLFNYHFAENSFIKIHSFFAIVFLSTHLSSTVRFRKLTRCSNHLNRLYLL